MTTVDADCVLAIYTLCRMHTAQMCLVVMGDVAEIFAYIRFVQITINLMSHNSMSYYELHQSPCLLFRALT